MAIPLTIAAWLRYLLAIDDNGNSFEPSADPLLATLQEQLKNIKLGDNDIGDKLKPILSNEALFGLNLYEAGIGQKVEQMFIKMLKGKGAVRATLHECLA